MNENNGNKPSPLERVRLILNEDKSKTSGDVNIICVRIKCATKDRNDNLNATP